MAWVGDREEAQLAGAVELGGGPPALERGPGRDESPQDVIRRSPTWTVATTSVRVAAAANAGRPVARRSG